MTVTEIEIIEISDSGPRGVRGYPGPTGPTGPTGVTGPIGETGVTGPSGVDGIAGGLQPAHDATSVTISPYGVVNQFSSEEEALLFGLDTDTFPQIIISSTGFDGIYIGDGTDDPYSRSNLYTDGDDFIIANSVTAGLIVLNSSGAINLESSDKVMVIGGNISSPGSNTNSEQFGLGAIAAGLSSVAIGLGAYTIGAGSTVIGFGATNYGDGSIFLSTSSFSGSTEQASHILDTEHTIDGQNIGIGYVDNGAANLTPLLANNVSDTEAPGQTISIGVFNEHTAGDGTHFGSIAPGSYESIVIGYHSAVYEESDISVILGQESIISASSRTGVAIGYSVTIGENSPGVTVVGAGAGTGTNTDNTIVIGNAYSDNDGEVSVVIGHGAYNSEGSYQNVLIGENTSTDDTDNYQVVVIGGGAGASSYQSVAIGAGAYANGHNSVALGYDTFVGPNAAMLGPTGITKIGFGIAPATIVAASTISSLADLKTYMLAIGLLVT